MLFRVTDIKVGYVFMMSSKKLKLVSTHSADPL